MNTAAEILSRLLDEEAIAARASDLDGLERIQRDKRTAVERLAHEPPDDARLDALRAKASANLRLLRTLTQLLRGIAQVDEASVYQRSGATAPPGPRLHRGAL